MYLKKTNDNGETLVTHVSHQFCGNVGDTVLAQCSRYAINYKNTYKWAYLSLRKKVDISTIDMINSSKALVIGGGGLFLPDGTPNSVSGWQWPCPKELLNQITVPIIIFGVGFNYFRGQEPNSVFIENLNAIIDRASFVGLRNSGSITAVKSLVNETLRNKIVYQPCTTTIINRLYGTEHRLNSSKKIAVNISFDRINLRFGIRKNEILSEIAEAISVIHKNGYQIYNIAHCSCDLEFSSFLQDLSIPHTNVDATFWLPQKLISFYKNIDVVIGMRGHAQMIPFGVGTRIISLGTHAKMKWFLEDINSTDWYIDCFDNKNSIAGNIINAFNSIVDSETVLSRLYNEQDRLYNITQNNISHIQEIIGQ